MFRWLSINAAEYLRSRSGPGRVGNWRGPHHRTIHIIRGPRVDVSVRNGAIDVRTIHVDVARRVGTRSVRIYRAIRVAVHGAIGVAVSNAIRVSVYIAVAVCIGVGVAVVVPVARALGFVFVRVDVRVYVVIGVGRVFVGRDCFRRLAFFGRATDVHRDSLTSLHDFTRARQLKHHCVGLGFVARSRRAHAKLQIRVGENFLRIEPVLADDVGNRHFRATQREIDGRYDSEEKNDPDRDHDSDAAED